MLSPGCRASTDKDPETTEGGDATINNELQSDSRIVRCTSNGQSSPDIDMPDTSMSLVDMTDPESIMGTPLPRCTYLDVHAVEGDITIADSTVEFRYYLAHTLPVVVAFR